MVIKALFIHAIYMFFIFASQSQRLIHSCLGLW